MKASRASLRCGSGRSSNGAHWSSAIGMVPAFTEMTFPPSPIVLPLFTHAPGSPCSLSWGCATRCTPSFRNRVFPLVSMGRCGCDLFVYAPDKGTQVHGFGGHLFPPATSSVCSPCQHAVKSVDPPWCSGKLLLDRHLRKLVSSPPRSSRGTRPGHLSSEAPPSHPATAGKSRLL